MDYQELYDKAYSAGKTALTECVPTPMTVVSEFGGEKKVYHEAGGMCGFAWINVKPGTSPFSKWLKKTGKGSKSYDGGLDIWVHDGGQSIEKKTKFAEAFAKVLRENGIERAYANSRLD